MIIKEDGTTPPIEEAEEPLRLLVFADGINRNLYFKGGKWAIRPIDSWLTLRNILSKIEEKLDMPNLPEEMQSTFQAFQSVPDTVLEKQEQIRFVTKKWEGIYNNDLLKHRILTTEIYEKLNECFEKLIESVFLQHDVQLATREDRKAFLKYLRSRALRSFPLMVLYIRLKMHHHFIDFGVTREDEASHKRVRNDLTRDKGSEEQFKEIIAITRNPR
ncbi:hypothetical protein C8P63_1535 [Melghirimyces profundicolus]|uniref:Uncharacterized protein n=1 Tax=Melghirimyces profundicolus TaxID=1242148 RepID=A0A2T6ATU5_9BACL|nr:hypothetical protein [Melghirimyces profundicolus]PTX47239.1 hypothetical protein C8P63_1535 [Melghirimyces profundicolus]